jgi:hypothetical protein
MSRRTSKVTGPDLFYFGASQAAPSESAHAMPPPVLPSDLARCLAHLTDPDSERLLVAVNEEAKRRGMAEAGDEDGPKTEGAAESPEGALDQRRISSQGQSRAGGLQGGSEADRHRPPVWAPIRSCP